MTEIGSAMDCRAFARILEPYLDGGLGTAELVDAERHLEACEHCRERVRFHGALRGTLKRVVQTRASDSLRARVTQAMEAEAIRSEGRRASVEAVPSWVARTVFIPLVAAAALVFVLLTGKHGRLPDSRPRVQAAMSDNLLAELVAEHARPLPPEQTEPQKVRALSNYVGVPVSVPARFTNVGARFVGGRVLPMHSERAAMLQYEIDAGGDRRRVSVFVYDPRRIQVNDDELKPRAVGRSNVRVGRAQGYSIAVMQAGGVGYAVASDLEEDKSAQLAASVADTGEE